MAVDIIARGIAAGRVPITAYDMAVAGGYVGTKEEFEADMGNSGTNATNAANSAAAAAESAAEASALADDIAQYKTDTMTAPANITEGEYVLAAGTLYRATANIASGSTLTPNGNVVAVTVGEELTKVIASDAQKADADGTSPNLTAGNALQLVSTVGIEDQVPYNFRTSGGTADIGDREEDMVVGGTIAWNQIARKGLYTTLGATVAYDSTTGIATVTPTAYDGNSKGVYNLTVSGQAVVGHLYLCSAEIKPDNDGSFNIGFTPVFNSGTIPANQWTRCEGIILRSSTSFCIFLRALASGWESGSFQYRNVQCFDLTRMFGTTIANYIYSLEQANKGDGIAWFKKLFPKEYYEEDIGTLQSVQTSSHKMVGFNAIPQPFTRGGRWGGSGYQTGVGNKYASQSKLIRVVPGATYCFTAPNITAMSAFYVYQFDADGNYVNNSGHINITVSKPYGTWTVGDKVCFVGLYIYRNSAEFTEAEIANVNWNLSWDGEKDGTYEPYVEYNYPLDSSLELRGVPTLDENNKLRYDGDTYASDGTVTRKYAYAKFVGADGEGWTDTSGSGNPRKSYRATSLVANTAYTNMLTNGIAVSTSSGTTDTAEITCRGTAYLSTYFYIFAPEDKIADLTALKAWLAANPVEIVYPVDTPTTETADPYTNPQIVSDWGTEEYVDAGVEAGARDVAIPVGHETLYQQNLRAKLEMAPDSPGSGDGDYIVRQENGTNTYVPLVIPNELPAQPSEDGTYHLQVVVTGGVPTVSWVADT